MLLKKKDFFLVQKKIRYLVKSIKHKNICVQLYRHHMEGGRRGRDRMVVEFTTTYANSAYHH